MRKLLPPAVLIFSLLALLSLRSVSDRKVNREMTPRYGRAVDQSIIGCAPPFDPDRIRLGADGRYAPVFPGWGHYSYRVRTTKDSAQFFFDQGLNMYYSYHLPEALVSFKEAARQDPACVMAYWGQALSMGPSYNNYFYKMSPAVLPVLEQMNRAGADGTEKEKDLAEAMNKRYSADTSDSRRKELNRAYSLHLFTLIKKYPADPDLKALYVDAVMLEHTWNFWETDGTPKAWTTELVSYCDEILHDHPTHPAALHYQIHLVEASLHPEKALANADLLKNTLPGVSHMVHMSSHMYQRNGLYAKGVEVNETASRLEIYYDSMAPDLKIGRFALTHFDGVGSFCAMNANMYEKGAQSSLHLRNLLFNSYRPRLSSTFLQYLYMMPMFVDLRSGKWQSVMTRPLPDSSLHYAALLDDFGKGLASLYRHDMASARRYLDKLQFLMKDSSLMTRNGPFNRALESAQIAEAVLAGEIFFFERKPDEAIRSLEAAALAEDRLIYREPREWPIPVRHFLGARLLQLHRAAEAEKIYRQDLVFNPGNGWSLLGLSQSLGQQHRAREAATYQDQYRQAFSKADELPPASVY